MLFKNSFVRSKVASHMLPFTDVNLKSFYDVPVYRIKPQLRNEQNSSLDFLKQLPHEKCLISCKLIEEDGKIDSEWLIFIQEINSVFVKLTFSIALENKIVIFESNIDVDSFFDQKEISKTIGFELYINEKLVPMEYMQQNAISQGTSGYINKALTIINSFVKDLDEPSLILAKEKYTFKKEKKIYKTMNLIWISNKKSFLLDVESKNIPQHVNWEYSWLTRGHWRRIDNGFIGKDRYGNRIEIGRTWVSESIKNKELPFINPLRVIR